MKYLKVLALFLWLLFLTQEMELELMVECQLVSCDMTGEVTELRYNQPNLEELLFSVKGRGGRSAILSIQMMPHQL